MSAHASPLVGFNNNVVHRGRVFHIQTEDSGVKHPHVITHLFADGGRIVKSHRTDYTEHLEKPDRVQVLRNLMKEQHKAMFIALRDGSLDSLILEIFGESAPAGHSEKVAIGVDAPEAGAPKAAEPKPTEPKPKTPASQRTRSRRSSAPASARKKSKRPAQARSQRPKPRSQRPISDIVDVAQVQRAPKLPSDRFAIAGEPAAAVEEALAEEAPGGSTPPRGNTPLIGSRGDGKYAGARPAHIFDGSGSGRSLFGAKPLDEQCLDDAILGYLAGGEGQGDD